MDMKSEKQPGLSEWPVPWLNNIALEALRAWSRSPQLRLSRGVSDQAKPSSSKLRGRPGIQDRVDPPSSIDRSLHASMGRFTLGVSPAALWLAYTDWAVHLWASPGKRQELAEKAVRKTVRFATYLSDVVSNPACPPCIEPLPQDYRFQSETWQQWPFNLLEQGFLLNQQWWHNATTGIGGVSPHHEQVVSFMAQAIA